MEQRPTRLRNALGLAGLFAFVGVVLVLRSLWGIAPGDDGHYVATILRLLHGARPFLDDATLQVLGFYPGVPFAWVWTSLFGTTGIMLALRIWQVALTLGSLGVVVWALKPSFGPYKPLLAASLVVLAPPYNMVGLSYNNTATLCYLMAAALGVASIRDASRWKGALVGALLLLGSAAYPPLGPAAILMGIAIALLARDWRVALSVAAGFLGAALVVGGVLLLFIQPADVYHTYTYMTKASGYAMGESKLSLRWNNTVEVFSRPITFPLYALSILAALPFIPRRGRAWLVALVPAFAAIPGVTHIIWGGEDIRWFGWTASSYIILLAIGLLLPAISWVATTRNKHLAGFLLFTGAFAIAGAPLAIYATASGYFRGVWLVGMTPLVLSLGIVWLLQLAEDGGRWLEIAAIAFALAMLAFILFQTSFTDVPPWKAEYRYTSGPLAGIATTEEHKIWYDSVVAAVNEHVGPDQSLLVVTAPIGYVLADRTPLTNATWVGVNGSDGYTPRYYERMGATPDAVLVARDSFVEAYGTLQHGAKFDALLRWIDTNYQLVDEGPYWNLYLRRTVVPKVPAPVGQYVKPRYR